jgi:hypothetical protein
MLVRLVTGCNWVDGERLTGNVVSDTGLRARRDEWAKAGVFDQLAEVMIAAYDTEVGLEPAEALVDGSLHKAPCGGEGTGKSPVDRGKFGWKWSIASDANGIPMGCAVAPANRNDCVLLPATFEAVDDQGLLEEIETLHLDRGYVTRVWISDCAPVTVVPVLFGPGTTPDGVSLAEAADIALPPCVACESISASGFTGRQLLAQRQGYGAPRCSPTRCRNPGPVRSAP